MHGPGAATATAGRCPHALVEVWQANAAGRYRHVGDSWPAPLDPHFDGRRPGAHRRAGPLPSSPPSSPAPTRGATTTTPGGRRTSTSRCSAGPSPSGWSPRCTSRTTRCSARTRSSARPGAGRGSGWSAGSRSSDTVPAWALAYECDIVLRGRRRDAVRDRRRRGRGMSVSGADARRRRVGPVPGDRAALAGRPVRRGPRARPGAVWLRGRVLDGAGAAGARRAGRDLAGRPRRAASTTPTTRAAPCRRRPGFRGFGRSETVDGEYAVLHRQAGPGARTATAGCRRRTSTCRCSPAACSTGSSPGSTSPTRPRPTPRTRCCAALPDDRRAARCSREPTDGRLPARHRACRATRETVFFAV